MGCFRLFAAAAVLIAGGTGTIQTAQAQLVGNYGGQRADGTPVSISLSRFRGKTYLTFVQAQASTKCGDGTAFDLNTFLAGLLQTVTGPSVVLSAASSTTYIGGTLTFDNATRSVSGYLFEKLSKLAAAPEAPSNATICVAPRQPFAAVLDKTVNFNPKLVTWDEDVSSGFVYGLGEAGK